MISDSKNITKATLKYFFDISFRYRKAFILNISAFLVAVLAGGVAYRYFLAQLFEKLSKYQIGDPTRVI